MNKTFIIAEMSANHNQNKDIALQTIREAKKAGADAIKIQTYTADTITLNCDTPDFNATGKLWEGQSLYSLYQKAYTPWEWHKEIFEVAKEEGILCFSSPFDKTAVDLLEELGTPIYKIASPEVVDIPLIRYIASKHKPIILSTGLASIEDIELALSVMKEEGCEDITLLKCTAEYPAPIEDANLATLHDMKERFRVKVGISDHTMGCDIAVAAVALGAEVVEKHFIIDRSIGGPDSAFSMQAPEFKSMVDSIRNVEKAIGVISYPDSSEHIRRRSLYVAKNIQAGEKITEENVRSVRPGFGLHPKYLPKVLGKIAVRDLEMGERFSLDMIREE